MLSRDSRAERKWKAWRRMQFRYTQRCEQIDFEEDVLGPEIEAMKSGKAVFGMPPGALFNIRVIDDSGNSLPGSSTDTKPADSHAQAPGGDTPGKDS